MSVMIGEHGPELWVPATAGAIIPAVDLEPDPEPDDA